MDKVSLEFFDSDFDENLERKFSRHFRNFFGAADHVLNDLDNLSRVLRINLKKITDFYRVGADREVRLQHQEGVPEVCIVSSKW